MLCLKQRYLRYERDSLLALAETIINEDLKVNEEDDVETASDDCASVSTKDDSDYEAQEKESSSFEAESEEEDAEDVKKATAAYSKKAPAKPHNVIVTRSKTRMSSLKATEKKGDKKSTAGRSTTTTDSSEACVSSKRSPIESGGFSFRKSRTRAGTAAAVRGARHSLRASPVQEQPYYRADAALRQPAHQDLRQAPAAGHVVPHSAGAAAGFQPDRQGRRRQAARPCPSAHSRTGEGLAADAAAQAARHAT